MKRRAWTLLLILLAPAGAAAPAARDLGDGLGYVRVHRLPADLPARPEGRAAPCVIDLRYVKATDDAAAAFSAWLRFRANPRSPVFVLANGETAEPLRKVLAGRERGAGVILVGVESEQFRPDVPVKTTAAEERRAYDALEQGSALGALLEDNPRKPRNDEASLVRERLPEPLPEPSPAGDTTVADPAKPPVDATLQRAVHLHRALVALKKL